MSKPRPFLHFCLPASLLACLALGAATDGAQARAASSTHRQAKDASAQTIRALAQRLPRTAITKVDCLALPGICEVQAGNNLFYTDPAARYLIVGRIYDMETHQDLTAAKLLAINPDMLVGAAALREDGDKTGLAGQPARIAAAPQGTPAPSVAPNAPPQKVSLAGLPANGAIEWGSAGANRTARVTIFSDFHCGYCRMLHQTLREMSVRVSERPISILGTRGVSEAVICAEDKAAALEKAYAGEELPKRSCETSGLDVNEAFARQHSFTGTPVLVREDGAVLLGFRPRDVLEAWLKGGA